MEKEGEWERTIVLKAGEERGWWRRRPDQRIKPRTIVRGAINDLQALVLLDSGANVSILNARWAEKMRITRVKEVQRPLSIQGLSEQRLDTNKKACWYPMYLSRKR